MTRRWLVTVSILLGVCFVLSLILFPLLSHDNRTLDALGAVDGLLEDRPAPPFSLPTLSGEVVSLGAYRGEVVYLNFWAEYCATCRTELPSLQAFAHQLADSVAVVTVAIDDDPAVPRDYLSRAFPDGASFDMLADPGGETARVYGTVAVPETYVITPNGTILARLVGPQDFLSTEHLELAHAVTAGVR